MKWYGVHVIILSAKLIKKANKQKSAMIFSGYVNGNGTVGALKFDEASVW